MNPEAQRIQARLSQIAEYQRKGLMRDEEAEATRAQLLKRLMHLLVPDAPAPRLPWRVHVGAAAAMLVLVGSVAAYLWSGHAGLRARSEEMLAQGRLAAAQDDTMRRDRLARIAAGESLAPDQFGRVGSGASAPAAGASTPAAGAVNSTQAPSAAPVAVDAKAAASSTSSASRLPTTRDADAIAPLLSGRIELDPAYASRVAAEDALFVVVRLPNDPDGLPLAAMRVEMRPVKRPVRLDRSRS
jgi:hypothetical protein